jgi:crotonobetainyl-CoA:carnitine CoA-transferase CaiB-like acyl-CoA transferase
LRARDAGGGAQHIETSLYETAVNWLPYQLAGYLGSGRVPSRLGSGIAILAPYAAYATSDGRIMIAAGNDRLFATLCAELGAPELAEDERFATNDLRVRHRVELDTALAEPLANETTSMWLERLRAAGVPAAPIKDLAEVAASEQTRALGLLQSLPTDAIPELQLVAPPISVGGDRLEYASHPPALGEHTAEVLREAGLETEEIDALLAAGAVEQSV